MNEVPPIDSGTSRQKIGFAWIILAGVLLLSLGCVVFLFTRPARDARAADTAFRKATKTINPEQLRAWALDTISKYPVTNKVWGYREIPKLEMPSQIQSLYSTPPYAVVTQQESNSELNVQIQWGASSPRGFHWWLSIGSTNFIPFTNSDISYSYYQKAVWVAGIYYNRAESR